MKKTKNVILIAFLLVFGVFLSNFSNILSLNSNKAYAESETTKIYIEPENVDSNGICVANSNSKIGFYIRATNSVKNVVVHWRTRDMSAVASSGDYTAVDTKYTLNGTKSSIIYVDVKNQGAGTRLDYYSDDQKNWYDAQNSSVTTRNFCVEIVDIQAESSNVEIDQDNKSFIASSGYNYCYSVDKIKLSSGEYSYYFDAYDMEGVGRNTTEKVIISQSKSSNISSYKTYYSSAGNVISAIGGLEIATNYLDTNMAKVFANLDANAYEDAVFGDSKDITIGLKYTNTNETISKYELEFGGWGSRYVYPVYAMQKNVRYSKDYGEIILDATQSGYGYHGDGEKWYRWFGEWYEIKQYNKDIYAYMTDNEGGSDRYLYDIKIRAKLVDTTAPEIKETYLSTTQIKSGDKVGLSVRFTEPVQIIDQTKLPKITAIVNGNSMSYIDFEYVSGEGTDTLYFEWNPNTGNVTNANITKIELISFENNTSVSDFAVGLNKVSTKELFAGYDKNSIYTKSEYSYYQVAKADENAILLHNQLKTSDISIQKSYSLDLRKPELNILSSTPSGATKYAEVVLSLDNISSNATLYYTWSTQSETPQTYTNSVTELGSTYTIRAFDMNGTYYLHAKLVSDYGKYAEITKGTFKFDTSSPNINLTQQGNLSQRTFSISASDGEQTDGSVSGLDSVCLIVAKNQDGTDEIKRYTYSGSGNATLNKDVVISADDLEVSETSSQTFYISVLATDMVGNTSQIEFTAYKFDKRTYFDATLISALSSEESVIYDFNLSGGEYVIDLSNDVNITFSLSGITEEDTNSGRLNLLLVDANGTLVTNRTIRILDTDVVLMLTNELSSGLYTVYFTLEESGTTKYSNEIKLYLTKNMQDENLTYYTKLNSGTLFTNKVYKLSENLVFYYMDKDNNINSQKYSDTTLFTAFSSQYEATQYLKYMEYQDLYPIILTKTQAELLNGKSSPTFQKATGETMTANINQVWIRYKTSTFDLNPTSNQWVYYYYGTSTELKQENLSANILLSISEICERLAKNYGESVILSGEDNLNKYGEPTLSQTQIHYNYESFSLTKCGISFDKAIVYNGDTKIYNSIFAEGNESLPIATNFEFENLSTRKLLYKNRNNTTYTEIDLTKYTTMSEIINSSGIFDIIEMEENGVKKFSVYVDKDAPSLLGYIQSTDGSIQTKTFDKNANGITFTAKSFTFGEIDETEKDELAYVSVYRYSTTSTGELLCTYLRSDLIENAYVLTDGDYHIAVYDRCGNNYSFILRINSKSFVCDVVETKDEYITVTCNREENQILTYQVYLNGDLISSTYSQKQRFTQSGSYKVYICDIYNNEYTKEIDFSRSYPALTWQYYDADFGDYVTYSETSTKMKITRVNETTFKIITSALLQFKYDTNFEYKFTSEIDYSENNISHIVKLTNLEAFGVKVSYASYSEIEITYICEVDNTAPTIVVKNVVDIFDLDEDTDFTSQLETKNVGDLLEYNSIGYTKRNSVNSYLSSGDIVQSKFLKLSVSDNTSVSKVNIYINDSLFETKTDNFQNIVLSKYGEYKIEAIDQFGNTSEFTFTNKVVNNFEYYVDSKIQDTDYSCQDYFENNDYKKIEYGNQNVVLKMLNNCLFTLKLQTNSLHYLSLKIDSGKIYYLTYKVGIDNGTKIVQTEKSSALFDYSNSQYSQDNWYLILNSTNYGLNIYAKYDENNNIYIKVENSDSGINIIDGRIYFSNYEPFYFVTKLSLNKTDVNIYNEENDIIETNQNEKQIKINKNFHFDEQDLKQKQINYVKVYYSLLSTFTDYDLVFDGTNYYNFEFSKDGIYLIEINNIFGNITKYYIAKYETFLVIINSEFDDGKKVEYSIDYTGEINSNKKIEIFAYSENITINATKDNEIYTDYLLTKNDSGISVITISENGKYFIQIIDEYGNYYQNNFEINKKTLTFNENLIYGYNENALRKSEGYTNQKLSISSDEVESEQIKYISITYNQNETILFDNISENKVDLDTEKLKSAVGNFGDGEYAITFRDKFGNLLQKTIHYKDNSMLSLSRTSRSSTKEESYELEKAIESGFWSNNMLKFTTTATDYIFTVDGKKVECPYSMVFTSTSNEGNFIYDITYLDEYGFSYQFKAHLFRQTLSITLANDIKTITQDGLCVTKDNIKVTFMENATCTYSLGGITYNYSKDEILTKDGTYHFMVSDMAGNVSALTVKKDSVVEYQVIESLANTEVINGGIVCTSSVSFKAKNNDSAYLKYVFLDGELIENYTDNKFTKSGKWEFIASDSVGNESYFTFQIITHKINKFDYTTPYGYTFTEIWYTFGDNIPVSYMQYVTNEGKTVSLTENGTYSLVMTSTVYGKASSFSITVNNFAPQVELVGCNENETTINDITLKGYSVGDTVEIYKDGKLAKSYSILTKSDEVPAITEGGEYRIVVTNEAGVKTELSFTRKNIPNTAGNVLIIFIILAISTVVFIGLVYRQRSKVDDWYI